MQPKPNVTHESLNAEWERVHNALPDALALRMRRALSWLERAEKEAGDDAAAFIFYWIAFNAAYAQDRRNRIQEYEQSLYADYFNTILSIDSERTIYDAIWERFPQSIRVLLNNKFVFQPFWDHEAGLGHDNWEDKFDDSRSAVHYALVERNTGVILNTVFDRLYTLRNQLLHGAATWNGSVNRGQVRDGASIMAFLAPLFIGLMMSRPEIDWGSPDYPVVR